MLDLFFIINLLEYIIYLKYNYIILGDNELSFLLWLILNIFIIIHTEVGRQVATYQWLKLERSHIFIVFVLLNLNSKI